VCAIGVTYLLECVVTWLQEVVCCCVPQSSGPLSYAARGQICIGLILLRKPDGRGKGATVVGAISEKQGLVHYSILQESNNAVTFSNFISELVRKIKGEAYVYMDNLSVHNAKVVKDHFNDRIKQMFLPPYSCSLNPIERVWHLAKQRWKKLMTLEPELV
jgi:hypothetical protein